VKGDLADQRVKAAADNGAQSVEREQGQGQAPLERNGFGSGVGWIDRGHGLGAFIQLMSRLIMLSDKSSHRTKGIEWISLYEKQEIHL
jgi:hypothetical protein